MARTIRDSVVVITGASSGIGRAAALLFAQQGANLVVAARNEHALKEVCEACENLGGHALACPCDVSKEEDVQKLAEKAVQEFGRIDTWVNNAAVSLFGRFEELPPESWRKVIETNLFGYVYGARAVLPHFREQGEGVLINVSSIIGKVAFPYVSAYTTSKFAIRGFSEALRIELRNSNIKVCTVYPASTDTPIFQHAGNYSGRAIKPVPPVYRAEDVAAAILACAHRPRPEIHIGLTGQGMIVPHAMSKRLYDQITGYLVEHEHFQERPAPQSEGNLYQPMEEWASVSGNWPARSSHERGGLTALGLFGLLIPAGIIGLLIAMAMRSKPTRLERLSHAMKQPSPTRRKARRWAERAGIRERSLGEKVSDQVAGLSAAVLATGLLRRLTGRRMRSAARDVRRRGESKIAEMRRRGMDVGHRAKGLGRRSMRTRRGRDMAEVPGRLRREYERRYRPGPMGRVRRALGV